MLTADCVSGIGEMAGREVHESDRRSHKFALFPDSPSVYIVFQSVICYILCYKHHYDCSHSPQPKRNQCNQLQVSPLYTTHSLGKLNDALETVFFGAKSGVFLRYCSWNGSVTVLTANRWQRKLPTAGTSAPHIMPDHTTFLNYVIAFGRISWLLSSFAVT